MGASSSTCSSSITTHGSGKYDLFVSFRGEDIRDKFRSHFCDALSRKKIDFFVDDKFERGDEIWPALSEAIEGSRISVVMFSKNYASSKWCLRELVKILECKKTNGQIVIPVFYEVEPSHVRNQRGSFENAFIHHEKISEDEKQKWRAALTDASNLSGFDSSKIRPESKFVDEIIIDISKKLKVGSPLNELSGIVGISSRIEQVISLLCIGKSDFEIVGIWGMGGIGKTTIAEAILNQVSGQFEEYGISVLIDKALINISSYGKVDMHDLLQEMGHELVREESRNLGERSRLHNHEDVCLVLRRNMGTCAVKSISLNMSKIKDIYTHSEVFEKMWNVRFLKFYNPSEYISKVHGPNYLPDELRYLCWDGYPSKALPSNLSMENLVELKLCGSSLEGLWEGEMDAPKLKQLDLSKSQHLTRIPEFSNAPCLEVINLVKCEMLKHVSPNIFKLKSLRGLFLNDCSNLEIFPEIPEIMENLEMLHLSHTTIKELPVSIENLNGLSRLSMYDCKMLKHVPSNILKLKSLHELNFYCCSNLEIFPEIPEIMESLEGLNLSYTAIKELPAFIENLNGLQQLFVVGCRMLKHVSSNIFKLKSLRELYLDGCSNLEIFPEIPEIMESLKTLSLSGTAIKELPISIENLDGLSRLSTYDCKMLKHVSPNIFKLKSLDELNFDDCSNLEIFPEIPEIMESLERLNLSCTAIKELPASIENLNGLSQLLLRECRMLKHVSPNIFKLKSLQNLALDDCSNLEIFPEIPEIMESLDTLSLSRSAIKELPVSIENLNGLSTLFVHECRMLKHVSPNIFKLKSLDELNLDGCSNLEIFPEIPEIMESLETLSLCRTAIKELPVSIENLNGLSSLSLRCCHNLEVLPSSICNLRSLSHLDIAYCSKLQSLPELPLGLQTLYAMECKQLKSLPEASYFAEGLIASNQYCNFWGCEMLDQKIIDNVFRESLLLIQRQKGYEKEIGFQICFLGCDIPDWINFKNSGSYLNIKLPLHISGNRKLLGFGLWAIVSGRDAHVGRFFVSCECRLATKSSQQNYSTALPTWNQWYPVAAISYRHHVVFRYLDCSDYDELFEDDFITCSFEFKTSFGAYKITNCGVHPIFEEPIISLDKFGTTNQDFVETSGSGKRVCDDYEAEIKPNPKRICRE